MNKNRLEAFSDGVLAIIITIMVLELKVPHGADLAALRPVFPTLLSYLMSFVFVGIYWNNHHHLLQSVRHVNGAVLWANMHLLFWLSLLPFVTAWAGENHFAGLPVALYGIDFLMAGIAYAILVRTLIALHGPESKIARAIGADVKGWTSLVVYAAGVVIAFWNSWLAWACYVAVAVVWLVPDRRFERELGPATPHD